MAPSPGRSSHMNSVSTHHSEHLSQIRGPNFVKASQAVRAGSDIVRRIGRSWLRPSLMEFLLFGFKARLKGESRRILKPTATQGEQTDDNPEELK